MSHLSGEIRMGVDSGCVKGSPECRFKPIEGLARYKRSLVLRVLWSGVTRWRIGNRADISDERLNISFTERISPRGHESGFTQCRAAMADHRRQVGVTDGVVGVALAEGMRLDLKIVVIGDAHYRGLRIMASLTVLAVEAIAESLLVAERNLFQLEFDLLV